LVAELLSRNVKVIVTSGTTAIQAAKDGTTTVPIVMMGGGDPVGTGLVQRLARPGGNSRASPCSARSCPRRPLI
jgi:putative ABC transport system substrate-binding protein